VLEHSNALSNMRARSYMTRKIQQFKMRLFVSFS